MTASPTPTWKSELGRRTSAYPDDYVFSQYHELASEQSIREFLVAEPLWNSDQKEWIAVARATSSEALRVAVRDVVEAIIQNFGSRLANSSVTRNACITRRRFPHRDYYHTERGSRPPIVIKASGPSFEDPIGTSPETVPEVGYTNAASCFNVRQAQKLRDDDLYHAEQSAVFAKYVVPTSNIVLVLNALLQTDIHSTTQSSLRSKPLDLRAMVSAFPF